MTKDRGHRILLASMRWPLLFLLLPLAAPAGDAKPAPKPLYVRVKNARVLGQPDLKATPVAELQPGAQVRWLGASPETRQLHHVALTDGGVPAGTEGWMLQATLSPRPPSMEYAGDDGKPIDGQAFVSSGAAAKALGGMAQEYAAKKNLGDLAAEMETAASLSAAITPEALQARARTLGLAAEPAPEAPAKASPAPKKKPAKKGAAK